MFGTLNYQGFKGLIFFNKQDFTHKNLQKKIIFHPYIRVTELTLCPTLRESLSSIQRGPNNVARVTQCPHRRVLVTSEYPCPVSPFHFMFLMCWHISVYRCTYHTGFIVVEVVKQKDLCIHTISYKVYSGSGCKINRICSIYHFLAFLNIHNSTSIHQNMYVFPIYQLVYLTYMRVYL